MILFFTGMAPSTRHSGVLRISGDPGAGFPGRTHRRHATPCISSVIRKTSIHNSETTIDPLFPGKMSIQRTPPRRNENSNERPPNELGGPPALGLRALDAEDPSRELDQGEERMTKSKKERMRQKRRMEERRGETSGNVRTVSDRSPQVDDGAVKKRKLMAEVKQNKAGYVVTREDGMDLTVDEVDRVGKYLDLVLPTRGRRGKDMIQIEYFSYSWGRLSIGLKDKSQGKGLAKELEDMERLDLKLWKEEEAPEPLLYVGFVYSKRGTGAEWVTRLAETYHSAGLTMTDFRLRGEAKKPHGTTVILQLSENAVEMLSQSNMVAYVGVSRVELRKWEAKRREEDDDEDIMEVEELIK